MPSIKRRRLDRLLEHRNLALVELEIDNLPGFRFLARQFLLHFPLELIFRQRARLVQPGCTIELLPIPAAPLSPAPVPSSIPPASVPFWPAAAGAHGSTSGSTLSVWIPETVSQKLVKGLQFLQPPVLPRPDFTEISSQFHEAGIPFGLLAAPRPGSRRSWSAQTGRACD